MPDPAPVTIATSCISHVSPTSFELLVEERDHRFLGRLRASLPLKPWARAPSSFNGNSTSTPVAFNFSTSISALLDVDVLVLGTVDAERGHGIGVATSIQRAGAECACAFSGSHPGTAAAPRARPRSAVGLREVVRPKNVHHALDPA